MAAERAGPPGAARSGPDPADLDLVRSVAEPFMAAGAAGVVALTLGGSRADGTHREDSDYDVGLYYRGELDVAALRSAATAAGYAGELTEVGGWGGGLMNGGGWLAVGGRRVDLIYRDLSVVEHWWSEALAGRFVVERLPFYLCGIPSYTLLGELALSVVVFGSLPDERPDFPVALRSSASDFWHESARLQLDFGERAYGYGVRARSSHAASAGSDPAAGRSLEALGTLARVSLELAHSRVAAAGRYVLNEKRLLEVAGLADLRAGLEAGTAADAAVELAARLRDELGDGPGQ